MSLFKFSRKWMRGRFGSYVGLVTTLALAPFPAMASEWWYVNSGPGRVVFVDAQSIERNKDSVSYWTMHVIRPAEPEVMTKSHMRAECGKRRIRLLEILRFDERGREIGDAHARLRSMQMVAPDTLGDVEFRFACGDQAHRVTNDLFPLAIDEVAFAEALIARGNKPTDAHDLHEAMTGREVGNVLPQKPDTKTKNVSQQTDPQLPDMTQGPLNARPEENAIEIAQLKKACATETVGSCAELGTRFANGQGVTKDVAQAAVFLDKACTGGDPDSCTLLGIAYYNGNGVAQDANRATAAFARACEIGGAADCGNFGLALVNGSGVTKDAQRAFTYFDRACDNGNAASCSSLGAAYSMGVGIKADARRAMRLFKKSCDGDDAGGCYNLGVVYDQGLGVRKDPARAASLYVGACDQDDGAACGNLGTLVQNGRGIDKDAVRAAVLFRKSCDLKDADGCLNLGLAYQAGSGVVRDKERARIYFRRSLSIEPDKAGARRALAELRPD
ncbi:hypothetical protein D3Y57_19370 [Sphingomonas paeninsulae]|uniref:Surface-adhesin protein E-like domain-containing protein n=1 Tax=Sphingomonas paeninsulae TaxID=2319844 RepID=A0A494TDS4_SPHPE|nr:hypothetical protein D3Y57_19370 [Sphingomonas paeninsulae]